MSSCEAERQTKCLPARNVLSWEKSQCKKKLRSGDKKNNPINCSGCTPGTKKPPLEFCGGFILFGICRGLPPLKHNPYNPEHHGNKCNCRNDPILPINHAVTFASLKDASSLAALRYQSSRPKSLYPLSIIS